jgi:hypothetical protein
MKSIPDGVFLTIQRTIYEFLWELVPRVCNLPSQFPSFPGYLTTKYIYLTAAATFIRVSSETGSLPYQTSHPIINKMRGKEWIS